MNRRRLGLCLLVPLLAACSSSGRAAPTNAAPSTSSPATASATPSPAASLSPGPLPAGPTTVAVGTCPWIATSAAQDATGVRLGRVTVVTSGASTVGCRFYANQDPQFKTSEHMPGPDQPVAQIDVTAYTDTTAAHNGLATLAAKGTGAYRDDLSAQEEAVAFQTTFDPTDGASDWVYAFHKDTRVIAIYTAQTDTALDARNVAAAIAAAV